MNERATELAEAIGAEADIVNAVYNAIPDALHPVAAAVADAVLREGLANPLVLCGRGDGDGGVQWDEAPTRWPRAAEVTAPVKGFISGSSGAPAHPRDFVAAAMELGRLGFVADGNSSTHYPFAVIQCPMPGHEGREGAVMMMRVEFPEPPFTKGVRTR